MRTRFLYHEYSNSAQGACYRADMNEEHKQHERLVEMLCDDAALAEYKAPYDGYLPSLFSCILADLLIEAGNLVYGEKPSYLKFRAIEVIARVPYHSWSSALFTLLTLCYSSEKKALRLSRLTRFTSFAAENETMHVVVISELAKKQRAGYLRYTLIPMLFAFVYFWLSYLLYLLHPKTSLEINYFFEQHAFEQYDRFLRENAAELQRHPVESEFLNWYGRSIHSEYDFFRSVRNDEIIHRNRSVREMDLHIHALS
jgi:ubiquinol oxidase